MNENVQLFLFPLQTAAIPPSLVPGWAARQAKTVTPILCGIGVITAGTSAWNKCRGSYHLEVPLLLYCMGSPSDPGASNGKGDIWERSFHLYHCDLYFNAEKMQHRTICIPMHTFILVHVRFTSLIDWFKPTPLKYHEHCSSSLRWPLSSKCNCKLTSLGWSLHFNQTTGRS